MTTFRFFLKNGLYLAAILLLPGALITGIVLKRNYREGRPVAQGQSMFTIDPAPFEVAVARAEAALASADARFAQTQRNSARLKPLFEAKAASQKDYDDAASAEQI